jgi:hypothetical protein
VEAHKESVEDACYLKFLIHQAVHPNKLTLTPTHLKEASERKIERDARELEEQMEQRHLAEVAEFATNIKRQKEETWPTCSSTTVKRGQRHHQISLRLRIAARNWQP